MKQKPLTDEELMLTRFVLGMLIELTNDPIELWLLKFKLASVNNQISNRDLGAAEFNLSLKWSEDESEELPQISTFTRLPCEDDEVIMPASFREFINQIQIVLPERNS